MPDDIIAFRLNGRPVTLDCAPSASLAEVLRERCSTRGVKIACSRAVCGSCTVLIDGRPGASCALFAYHADGAEVITVEGLARPDGTPDPIQAAFAEHAAFQCGYCTAGMILLTKALLDAHPDPDRDTVVEWISSGICRCTGYSMIVDAVLDAARRRRSEVASHG